MPCFAVDAACRIVARNEAATRILGLAPGEASIRPCYDLLDGRTPAGSRLCRPDCLPRRLAARGRPFECLAMRGMGSLHESDPIELATMVLSSGNGDGLILLHLIRSIRPPPAAQVGPSSPNDGHLLSTRETEVLVRIAAGSCVKEVAFELSIRLTTARTHVRSILRKLGVQRQIDAVLAAQCLGLL